MEYNNISSTNFGAKYLKTVSVKKLNPNTARYRKNNISFVEFDPQNEHDLITLYRTAKAWKGANFALPIAEAGELIAHKVISPNKNKIYILTSQQDSFDKLHTEYILGMAHLNNSSRNSSELAHFQVDPKQKYGSKNREYKQIGTAMLNELKNLCKNSLRLFSSTSATGFYERQGFEEIDEAMLEYIWRKK